MQTQTSAVIDPATTDKVRRAALWGAKRRRRVPGGKVVWLAVALLASQPCIAMAEDPVHPEIRGIVRDDVGCVFAANRLLEPSPKDTDLLAMRAYYLGRLSVYLTPQELQSGVMDRQMAKYAADQSATPQLLARVAGLCMKQASEFIDPIANQVMTAKSPEGPVGPDEQRTAVCAALFAEQTGAQGDQLLQVKPAYFYNMGKLIGRPGHVGVEGINRNAGMLHQALIDLQGMGTAGVRDTGKDCLNEYTEKVSGRKPG